MLRDTLILQFSEFGRRITENGSNGTDHGAAGLMMAIGGTVRGGLYGTAARLNNDPDNQTLENNGGDVRHETDFRSVYAKVIESWLGADANAILGGDFRAGAPRFFRASNPNSKLQTPKRATRTTDSRTHASDSRRLSTPLFERLPLGVGSWELGVRGFSPRKSP